MARDFSQETVHDAAAQTSAAVRRFYFDVDDDLEMSTNVRSLGGLDDAVTARGEALVDRSCSMRPLNIAGLYAPLFVTS